MGGPTVARRSFEYTGGSESISVQAKSLELRAALSLSRLWVQERKSGQAHELLEPVFNSFTEGVETEELREAKAFLDELMIKESS